LAASAALLGLADACFQPQVQCATILHVTRDT
jgi:hypothetical protein